MSEDQIKLNRAQTLYTRLRRKQLACTLEGRIGHAMTYTHRIHRIQNWARNTLGLYTLC